MAFDASRLRFGDMIAGGGALVLLISLFLDWYGRDVGGVRGVEGESGSAFQFLGLGPIFLLLVALAVIAIVVMRGLGSEPVGLPVPLSTVILGLGALAALYVLFRLLVVPDGGLDALLGDRFELGRKFGVFLAFVATLAVAAGGFLSARERGEAVPGVDGPIGGGAGGSPLGSGQSAGGPLGGGQPVGGQQPAGGAGAASAGVADPGAQAGGQPKADWYPDPQGQARLRYWDGTQWTDQTAD